MLTAQKELVGIWLAPLLWIL